VFLLADRLTATGRPLALGPTPASAPRALAHVLLRDEPAPTAHPSPHHRARTWRHAAPLTNAPSTVPKRGLLYYDALRGGLIYVLVPPVIGGGPHGQQLHAGSTVHIFIFRLVSPE